MKKGREHALPAFFIFLPPFRNQQKQPCVPHGNEICRLKMISKRQILLIVFLHRAEPYRNAMRKARRRKAAYLQLQGL